MSATPRPALRLGFAGTPDFAAKILSALLQAGFRPDPILTQPDRPRGRGRRSRPGAVKILASKWGLEVHQPASLKSSFCHELLAETDLLVVAAYGLLLPGKVLSAPRFGCINVHASLLPRWRGAAPIERAIMAGDSVSGVSLMQMDEGLDTGDIIASAKYPIPEAMTGDELHTALADLGSELLLRSLPEIDHLPRCAQPETGVTYAAKLTNADAELIWSDTSLTLVNKIRALNSRMPAFSFLQIDGVKERVRLLSASRVPAGTVSSSRVGTIVESSGNVIRAVSGDGFIDISEVQLSRGKGRPMAVAAALNGYPDLFKPGRQFLSAEIQKGSHRNSDANSEGDSIGN